MKKNLVCKSLLIFALSGILTACSAHVSESVSASIDNISEAVTTADNASDISNQAKTIRVGTTAGTWFPVIDTEIHAYDSEFSKDGITVEATQFTSGPSLTEALTAGDLDIAKTGDVPAITAAANGSDFIIFAKGDVDDEDCSILVKPDSDISSVTDLRGKKIATAVGTSSHAFLGILLKKNGMTFNDIELVNVKQPDYATVLEQGEVDAIAAWGTHGDKIEVQGIGKKIISSKGIYQNTGLFLVRTEFAKENPELVARFLKAYKTITDYITADTERTLDIISTRMELDKENYRRSCENTVFNMEFTQTDIDAINATKSFLLENGSIENDFDLSSYIDESYLTLAKELMQ